MITLEEISGRLEKKKIAFEKGSPKQSGAGRGSGWKPTTIDSYVTPSFNIKESSAKGAATKLKTKLSKVLAFIDSIKHLRANEGCTILPISVTNSDNLAIWGNPMGVSRGVSYMMEIGLISLENDQYQYHAYYDEDNTSKTYRYYKENEDKVKEYCATRGIEMFLTENVVYSMAETRSIRSDIDISKVRFSSRLRLIKPADLSKPEFEKQLTLCLYKNYPGLQFHILKANEINKKYYKNYPDLRLRFRIHFDWSSDGMYVKGIGVRVTNRVISVKKEDRWKILEEYGLTLEKDVNASVPRLTLSLNTGHWIDESEDIYERIFRVMEPSGMFSKEKRDAIKKLHMRAYFDSGDKATGHHTWLSMDHDGVDREDVCNVMAAFRDAIIKAEGGKLYGSEIFYVESCVYLMTLYDLLCSGHFVWLLYDCFYSTGAEDKELFEEMVSNGVKLNFEEFLRVYW